jgi:hypothetical protein
MIPNAFPASAGKTPVSLGRKTPTSSTGTALYHKNTNGINGVLFAEMQFVISF